MAANKPAKADDTAADLIEEIPQVKNPFPKIFTDEQMNMMAHNWQRGDGLPTVMETYPPVCSFEVEAGKKQTGCRVLVAFDIRDRRVYGMFDNKDGEPRFGLANIADAGIPGLVLGKAVDIDPDVGLNVVECYWWAVEGHDYLTGKRNPNAKPAK